MAEQKKAVVPAQTFQVDEDYVAKEFQIETKIRTFIQEIIDPALKKTEECVKLVEFFSSVIDSSSKKFDECYDIYEVLNEKTKLRFKEIDGLTIKLSQVSNEQIINHGVSKQEIKELKQEIVELKEQLVFKSDQISQLSLTNERLADELLQVNNKIQDTRGDYQDKIADFVKNHFSSFLSIQVEFAQIKEQFMLQTKSLEAHNVIFDDLQGSIDLYKIERVEVRQKIEYINNLLDEKAQKIDLQFFSERIERQLQNDMNREKFERNQQHQNVVARLDSHDAQLGALKDNIEKQKRDVTAVLEIIQSNQEKQGKQIFKLQTDGLMQKTEQDDHTKQLESHKTLLEQQANIVNELKQTVRKEFLKYDSAITLVQNEQYLMIQDSIDKNNFKLKGEILEEVNVSLQQLKDFKIEQSHQTITHTPTHTHQHHSHNGSNQNNPMTPHQSKRPDSQENQQRTLTSQLAQGNNSSLTPSQAQAQQKQQQQSANAQHSDLNKQIGFGSALDAITMKQIEDIVTRKIGEYKGNFGGGSNFGAYGTQGAVGGNPQSFSNLNQQPMSTSIRKPSIVIPAAQSLRDFDNHGADDIIETLRMEMKERLEEFGKIMSLKIKMDLQNSMITADDLDCVKRDLGTIDKLRKVLEETFERMKLENSEMSEKVERMSFKLTTVQSDVTIQNEYVLSQLKRVLKDKEAMSKTINALQVLGSVLSETTYISQAVQIMQEIHTRKSEQNNDHTSPMQIIPMRFLSSADGLIFETSNESIKVGGTRVNYRQQVMDKVEILSSSMASLVSAWEGFSRDAMDSTPGKVFKNSVIIARPSKIARIHSSGKTRPSRQRDREEDVSTSKLSMRDSTPGIAQTVGGGGSSAMGQVPLSNKSFHMPSIQQGNPNFAPYSSMNNGNTAMKSSQENLSPDLKQKRASMSVNHRKLLSNLKEFNQAHLVNIQKQITTPTTIEKYKNKVSVNGNQSVSSSFVTGGSSDVHKFNLTFVPQSKSPDQMS